MATMEDLTSLTTADDVAAFLKSEGCEGKRESITDCPIAKFVRRVYPDADDVLVTAAVITVYFPLESGKDGLVIWCTSAMAVFVRKFDDEGEYSDLIAS